MKTKHSIVAFVIFILIVIFQIFDFRWDFTENQRFTLSPEEKELVKTPNQALHINIFLTGEMTGNFRSLQNETKQWLKIFEEENSNFQYNIIDPIEDNINLDSLSSIGINGVAVPTDNKILRVFPYISINYNGKTTTFSLLNNKKIPINDRALQSIPDIPYKFFKALKKIIKVKKPVIGLLVHHDELLPEYMNGFLTEASDEFDFKPITYPFNSPLIELNPNKIPNKDSLSAIISAKPIKSFTDNDKLVLDQYVMQGGNLMLLTENVDAEMDSLFRSENIVSFPRNNNLDDFLFSYGIRIVPTLVKDLQAAYITLAIGEIGENTAYEQFPWPYFPLVISTKNHPITKTINNPLKFEFANPIEILPREGIKYDVLLATSPYTQTQKPLSYINFSEIENTNSANYRENQPLPLAVLLSGKITSAYKNRLQSQQLNEFLNETSDGKLLLISDGDFIKNHIFRGAPLPLGADKYSLRPDIKSEPSIIYDNAQFLINALKYMIGEDITLGTASNLSDTKLLNKNLVDNEKNNLRWISIIIPSLCFVLLFGILFLYRKKRYS